MYSLEVYGLTKRYGDKTVLNDVSFSVQSGESFAILGPQESGKTTLLRLLGGLEAPDQGRIIVNGQDITDMPASERHLGIILQNGYGLIPHMTAFENISMPLQSGLMNRNGKKEAQKQQVMGIAQSLQVEHLLERKVSTLSVREQLSVALARGFAKKPQLYLFDESFMQMDTPTRLAARREIVEFQRATQIPCIYITRDQPEAFALANRVAVVNEGEMQQVGTRAELFYAPATLWIAQWLGFPPMNTITGYLQGTYHPDGMHYRVWAKSMAPLLPTKWTTVLSSLQSPDVIVGIRPEDIIPEWEFAEKWHSSLCAVKVEVLASEWNQGKTLAQFQLPHAADQFMAVLDIPHDQLKIGQIITIAFDPAQFCLFHPRTQQLLYAPPVLPGSNRRMNNLKSSQSLHGYHLDRPR